MYLLHWISFLSFTITTLCRYCTQNPFDTTSISFIIPNYHVHKSVQFYCLYTLHTLYTEQYGVRCSQINSLKMYKTKKIHFHGNFYTFITYFHDNFDKTPPYNRMKSSKSISFAAKEIFYVNTIYLTDFLCIINLNIFFYVNYNNRMDIFELIVFRDYYPLFLDNFLHFYCIIYTQNWTKKRMHKILALSILTNFRMTITAGPIYVPPNRLCIYRNMCASINIRKICDIIYEHDYYA